MTSSFRTIDWVIIGLYLTAMAGVGIYFSRRQRNLDEYVLADRRMGWLPVGLSVMAALNSGMDYLMQPSATIRYGAVLALGIFSWLAIYPWIARVAFPFYRRLNFYTVYEYLEARFDVRVRTLGALIFVAWRLGWMATAMYVPSLAINAASGGNVDLNTVTIVVGTLVTIYTMLGGIQAVIWNDVVQFCIMFAGLAATAAIVMWSVPGGLPEIFRISSEAGKLDAFPALVDPAAAGSLLAQVTSFFAQPMTAVSLLVALIVGRMAQFTSDQVLVQRLQTTKSLADTRRAFVVNAASDALWMLGLSFIGLALFAYFQTHPLPVEYQTDKLLPYFMSLAFPAGAVGLVIAAIMAASLSSIDSAINSCSSVAVVDLYNRLWLGRDVRQDSTPADQRHQVLVSRIATLLFGAAGTTLACNVARLGNLIEINNRLVNAFTGPLFGIYLLAMFSRGSRSEGVLAAGVAGAAVSYYVAYHSPIGFLWPSTFGLAATMAVGWLAAVMAPAPVSAPGRKLTWRAVIEASEAAPR